MINGLISILARPTLFAKCNAHSGKSLRGVSAMAACVSLPLVFALSFGANAGTKVAFIADTGSGDDHRDVMTLIRDEGADLVLIQGDFGYSDNRATRWENNITSILGANFPVLSVVGNHEDFEWPLYKRYIQQRVYRAPGLSCRGDVGVKANCTYDNLRIVQVAAGITEVPGVAAKNGYDDYIRSSFNTDDDRWKICTWHKNQRAMQAYSKSNDTGWPVYNACLDVGAMIVNGHAHTYSRTHLMSDFENQIVKSRSSDMTIQPGQSFVAVSGLGGRDERPQKNSGDWFASIYTASQGATHGALFCTFEKNTAGCYFKAVNGAIPDRFTLRRGTAPIVEPPNGPSQGAGVFSRNDKSEFWWVAQNDSRQWTRRWISRSCSERLGGPVYRGNWQDLNKLATAAGPVNPCDLLDDGSVAPSRQPPYVFYRPTANEYRWIDKNTAGAIGSIWIDAKCAASLGGAKVNGNWKTLMKLAPAFDSIKNPCTSGNISTSSGYVFSRTDTNELRWIDNDANGRAGSIWIDSACASRLGGVKKRGDWKQLLEEAPGFDAIASPCN